jgi:hypothetical protein
VKINVRKLDAKIAKLQALRRLATDPDLSDFIDVVGLKSEANGNGDNSDQNGNGHTTALKGNVLAACKALGIGRFTIKEVYESMQKMENGDSGTEKSVANVLRLLAHEGDLLVVERGQGRRATVYGNRA